MFRIAAVEAREILDSRGRPTVEATLRLADGHWGTASVPSGASTGKAEAWELRDGDRQRYGGLGCRRAVASIEGEVARAVGGVAFSSQQEFDRQLCQLDGTANKSRLGANAVLAVSLAFARAAASSMGQPLYQYLAELVPNSQRRLPRPTINLFSGGKHAGGQVSIQDVLIVPHADTIDKCLSTAFAVYQAATQLIGSRYAMRPLKADEGGLAPPAPHSEAMLRDAIDAICRAGYSPGKDVSLAVDVAASHLYQNNLYQLDTQQLNAAEMMEQLEFWVNSYPLISIEDGLAEDDWENWPLLCRRLGGRTLLLGDDLLCTQPDRIRRAVRERAANALLLKVNQVGTLTEAAEAWTLAREASWHITVSARSGETEDHWLADLATAWGDHIKVGSVAQSDRLAKYNRLLAIERQTQWPVASASRMATQNDG